ncbi:hypothetical protein [Streptomyces sp. NBC_01497]|uniref:hypothetical protein n=1 Tax=Streptomyces sp. NBC_01497 TaxID=2903885 RepID=UPI002E30C004|nr:hypothetical protein [Streptomyces sp. NBC_01497]
MARVRAASSLRAVARGGGAGGAAEAGTAAKPVRMRAALEQARTARRMQLSVG